MEQEQIEFSRRTCAACGLPEFNTRDPLCTDGAYDEAYFHCRCYGSRAANEWRQLQRAQDPAYDSLSRRLAGPKLITCPHCQAALELTSKSYGMTGYSWPVNCTRCHRIGRHPILSDGKTAEAHEIIRAIHHDYLRSINVDQIDARIREVTRRFNYLAVHERCQCGGAVSIAAKARCPFCEHEAVDSCFYLVSKPLTDDSGAPLSGEYEEPSVPDNSDDAATWERYYRPILYVINSSVDRHSLLSMTPERLPALIRDLREQSRWSIWFPGCGRSPIPRLFAEVGFTVHATDFSESAVRFQQRGLDSNVGYLKKMMRAADPALPVYIGSLTAVVHDFRTPYADAQFDCVINTNAFQGFDNATMRRIAATHFAALKPHGCAIFDMLNVQGSLRNQIEQSLIDAGFYVPLASLHHRMRSQLDASGIPFVMLNNRPVIRRLGDYLDDAKREADTRMLLEITAKFDEIAEHFYEERSPDAKTATVIYSNE